MYAEIQLQNRKIYLYILLKTDYILYILYCVINICMLSIKSYITRRNTGVNEDVFNPGLNEMEMPIKG